MEEAWPQKMKRPRVRSRFPDRAMAWGKGGVQYSGARTTRARELQRMLFGSERTFVYRDSRHQC